MTRFARGLAALTLSLCAFGFAGAAMAQTAGLMESGLGSTFATYLPMNSGALAVGQGLGANPVSEAMSGDCTLNASAAITCTKSNGSVFGTAAFATLGTSGADVVQANANNVFSGANSFSGHVISSGSTPTLSSCGTSPAIVGDDKNGQVTMGTATPTGCTITFAAAYVSAPLCTVTWQATPLASQSYAVTNTAITLTQTATSSNKVNYHCTAQAGG